MVLSCPSASIRLYPPILHPLRAAACRQKGGGAARCATGDSISREGKTTRRKLRGRAARRAVGRSSFLFSRSAAACRCWRPPTQQSATGLRRAEEVLVYPRLREAGKLALETPAGRITASDYAPRDGRLRVEQVTVFTHNVLPAYLHAVALRHDRGADRRSSRSPSTLSYGGNYLTLLDHRPQRTLSGARRIYRPVRFQQRSFSLSPLVRKAAQAVLSSGGFPEDFRGIRLVRPLHWCETGRSQAYSGALAQSRWF